MKIVKTSAYSFLMVSAFMLFSCNNAETTSETNDINATSTADTSTILAYNPAMDPVTTGGQMVKRLGDTLGVKMYEFTVKPGESWGLHTHPDHTVYMLEGGKMALYMQETGRLDTLTFPTGMALVSGSLTDSGRNVGNTTIKMLVTDIYRPRGK